jgi:hypothetical protein
MKSSWEAQPLFPDRRRFGRVGGFSVKSLGGFWEGPISERTVNIGQPLNLRPRRKSGRLGDPTLPKGEQNGQADKRGLPAHPGQHCFIRVKSNATGC